LHGERTVKGLRKIVWAFFFCFPFETAYISVYLFCIYRKRNKWKTVTNENIQKMGASLYLLQMEMAHFRFLLQMEMENGSLFSLVGK
jgi:hypothetical protein